jgi:hypothetical protein
VTATFFSRYEKALRVSAGPAVVDGRLQGTTTVGLVDLDDAGKTSSAPVQYELFGPGDVSQVAALGITRRFPSPGSSDAEETKVALVEFGAADLPWRYTPAAAAGGVLRPWLVLVVGRRAPDELVLRPDGRVTLGPLVQAAHPLGDSWRWAHVHEVDKHEVDAKQGVDGKQEVAAKQIARVLSPVDLAADTEYVACLVPAFAADGTDSWTGAAAVTLDCYERWGFRTGPQGDFPELAAKLHLADLAAIEAAGGKRFGRADVRYVARTPALPGTPDSVLATAGALRLPPEPGAGPDPADTPPPAAVAAEVTALTGRIVTPDGRGVVTAPRYDEPFNAAGTPGVAGGWIEGLRADPRARGAAGLGAWNAIEWQDRISDAAAAKAGDLVIAADRIRHVALGVEASRSLWRRRVPTDPVERLAVLAPVLGRLPTTTGSTVLEQFSGRTPQLGAALLSSAARRALRPGPARTALAREGAGRFAGILQAANGCPDDGRDPADIDRAAGGDPEQARKEAIFAATGGDDELTSRILDHLGADPDLGRLIAAFAALAPGRDGNPDRKAIEAFLDQREFTDPDTPLGRWRDWMREFAPPEDCRPVDLAGLGALVGGAVDPTTARPPAAGRVLATLPGITHLGPVEIEPELDLPLWSFLSGRSPDWMLPGAGDLTPESVVGLSTNPAFVQALLAGANHQTTAELRWRNIPLVTGSSPLRKFWQRPDGDLDIVPIKGWPAAAALGSTLLADGGRGAEAVVAFRTTLFRRYPTTLVYLYAATGDFNPPADNEVLAKPTRKDPTFRGTIGDDITFFGFAVAPADLATHWVVLEEPPAGYRFYAAPNDVPPVPPPAPQDTAANFAYTRFALPVRVLIGPLL